MKLFGKDGITRRRFVAGSAAATAAAAAAVSLAGCSGDSNGNETTGEPQVIEDDSLIIDALDEYKGVDNTLKAANTWTLPLGTQLFHSDGVQAFGKVKIDLRALGVDLYTLSSHKIHGPKGIGALYVAKGASVHPLVYGGGQENGLRSGTENTFAIKLFEYAAAKKFGNIHGDLERVRALNDYVRKGLEKKYFEILSSESASPYILSVAARGLRGEVLLHMLDDAGVMVGTGSACSSKNRYSRVILACGLEERRAEGVLRISFSASNGPEEIKEAVSVMNRCAAELAERMR